MRKIVSHCLSDGKNYVPVLRKNKKFMYDCSVDNGKKNDYNKY